MEKKGLKGLGIWGLVLGLAVLVAGIAGAATPAVKPVMKKKSQVRAAVKVKASPKPKPSASPAILEGPLEEPGLAPEAPVAVPVVKAAVPVDAFNGKIFEIQLFREDEKKEGGLDRLIFREQGFKSWDWQKQGFKSAPYQMVPASAGPSFHVVVESPKKGTAEWNGVLRENVIEGTLVWTKGKKVKQYTFTGEMMPSLYHRLGGVSSIATEMDAFVEKLMKDGRILKNSRVKETFTHVSHAGFKYQMTSLICQKAGGKEKYSGRSMKEAHTNLGITQLEWDVMIKDLVGVLDDYRVHKSDQADLIAIFETSKPDMVVKAEE